jgi:dipeptide/tripeptide permease
MTDKHKDKVRLSDFPKTYWVVIMFEFFERGSYYGMMSFLSVYLTNELFFSKAEVGAIKGVIQPLLYLLPIFTGAIADKVGYRKTLLVAFSLLGAGYFLTSQVTDYTYVFASLLIMAIGAGTFKPVVSGTIAKVTDERTSSLGFGIFYWVINLGAFLFPLILVPMLKAVNGSYVMIASAVFTGAMILPTLFLFKEPTREEQKKEPMGQVIRDIGKKIWMVVLDWKFILFIFIYSIFWILYFQMFDTVLWYVNMFVDPAELNDVVSPVLHNLLGINWFFDVEHVTVINAGTIILLQLFISSLVKKTKPLPTMISGISFGIIGMGILALSQSIWVFIAGIIIFSIGEMTAHPKFISYLGMIAPPDKKATYMGFGFLYGVPSSLFGPIIGAWLYVLLVDNPMIDFIKSQLASMGQGAVLANDVTINKALEVAEKAGIVKAEVLQHAHTSELWLIFCGIGIVCITGLLLYDKLIGTRTAADVK